MPSENATNKIDYSLNKSDNRVTDMNLVKEILVDQNGRSWLK